MVYFENIGKISFEGPKSKNPLAFKHYNPNEMVMGQTMEKQLRFAVAYWHTFTGGGADPFGVATAERSWNGLSGMELAKARVEASFEFYEKMGVPYFCFHRSLTPLDFIWDLIKSTITSKFFFVS